MINLLNAEKIKKQLNSDITVFTFETVDSTNLIAKKSATEYKTDSLFIAEHQTSGRGRMGRTFYSPDKSGIYMSLLLRPNFSFEDYTLITTAAAVSVAKAIDTYSEEPTKIKWVNDIFLRGKKVCGILTEGVFESENAYTVLGIGVNLFEPTSGFPNDISQIAGGVFEKECEEEIKINLIVEIINNFYNYYSSLPNKTFLNEYKSKNMLFGKEITFIKNGETFYGVAQDIAENLELKVIDKNGNLHLLSSGEVTIGSKNLSE